jgi:t-SNARE complex subunit (syntaxin)
MHMGLLERYKEFHDTGANLLGFRNVVVDGIPEDSPNDVLTARKECAAAFDALDQAMKSARASYSRLMASLAGI